MWLLWPSQSPCSPPPACLGPEPHREGWVAAVGIAQPPGETRLPGMGQPPMGQPGSDLWKRGEAAWQWLLIHSLPPHPSIQEYLYCGPGRSGTGRTWPRQLVSDRQQRANQPMNMTFQTGQALGRKGCVGL